MSKAFNITAEQLDILQTVIEFAAESKVKYKKTKEFTTENGGTCMTIRVPVALLNRIRELGEEFDISAKGL